LTDAHVRDGAALVMYLAWLEGQLAAGEHLDEYHTAQKLDWFRSHQEHFIAPSFSTISASGPNSAMPHYKPSNDTARKVSTHEIYLVDSGGQYEDGTTDVTRTLHFGTPTSHEKRSFTRVLKGLISLSNAVFPKGTTGPALDTLARASLWRAGLNYRHGTGHGVGAYLGVHEGPFTISPLKDSTVLTSPLRAAALLTALQPGMVTSNEPGYYEAKKFGIRLENVMVVKHTQTKYNDDDYFGFSTFTLAPFQQKLIDTRMLSDHEIQWINSYHATVKRKLLSAFDDVKKDHPTHPYVDAATKWLEAATALLPKHNSKSK